MPVGTGDNGVYVTPANARGAAVDRVEVTGGTAAGLRRVLGATDASVLTRDEWLRTAYPTATFTDADEKTRLGFLLVLGIALLYTGISLANTLLMATSDRKREFASLRLAGATTGQVLRLVAAEALVVVAVGALLGLLVTALNLGGMWGALDLQSARSPLRLPWPELGAATGACALLAVVSAVLPAAHALRRRGQLF